MFVKYPRLNDSVGRAGCLTIRGQVGVVATAILSF